MAVVHAAPGGGILRRALRNAGLLLGGKSAAGAMQLATFAIAARALGAAQFGVFSVVVAQVMLLTGIAAFESNQAIIRYGVLHLAGPDRPAIQALFKAGVLLDVGAAAAAAAATVVVAPWLGAYLKWQPALVALAQAAAPLAFANAIATPKAVLRLLGRFDLLTSHAVVTPAARLAAFAGLAAGGAALGWYVAAWVVAGWLGAVAAHGFAWREARRRGLLAGLDRALTGLSAANPGVWRFSILSNLTSSVALIPTQASVLIVAAVLGAPAAGVFRIAREVATGLTKPIDLINQALYPDVARLVAARGWARLGQTAVRGGLIAGALGLVVTAVIWLASPAAVGALFGRDFAPAVPVLVLIGLATAIRMLALAGDPILYALGRPQTVLALASLAAGVFVAVMVWRLPRDGLLGAGYAFVAMALVGGAASALAAWRAVRALRDAPA